MNDKTAKIEAELHRVLKMYALQQGRTLHDVTEELLRDGLQKRGVEVDEAVGGERGTNTSGPENESISKD